MEIPQNSDIKYIPVPVQINSFEIFLPLTAALLVNSFYLARFIEFQKDPSAPPADIEKEIFEFFTIFQTGLKNVNDIVFSQKAQNPS